MQGNHPPTKRSGGVIARVIKEKKMTGSTALGSWLIIFLSTPGTAHTFVQTSQS